LETIIPHYNLASLIQNQLDKWRPAETEVYSLHWKQT